MTITCYADTRFPIERANGVQTMETCHALARRGHDVTLVVRPDDETPARDPLDFYGLPASPHLHIVRISGGASARGRRVRFLLGAVARAVSEPDSLVFTRDLGLAALLLQLPLPRRPRLVYESHGLSAAMAREMPALLGKPELAPTPAKLRRLESRDRLVWTQAAGYVTITRALAEDLAAAFGTRARVVVAPDGARGPARPLPARDSSRFIAGYAGHLYPWKGVDEFVRALALTSTMHGLIVGGHPREKDLARVTALVHSLGLADRVRITGLVPPAEVTRALAPASVLVLPNPKTTTSERYTSPLKLFDYLTMGRAIVASDLPALREVLTPDVTALLVPPGDPAALAASLRRVRDEAGLGARLAGAARALAPEYTWDRRAERLEAAFEAARAT